MKKVAIIMGSDSDWPVVQKAVSKLKSFGVETEVHVMSAHRTPTEACEFAKNAAANGFGVIIAAAGMAAHLAGALAANTTLPVIGVPVKGGAADGLDALLATVQMPTGIPVATVALNGAKNAAVLAAQILALGEPALALALKAEREAMGRAIAQKDKALQEELAALLGTTKQVVSRYENGQRTPKVTVVEEFARRLGVPLSALLGAAAAQGGALRVPVLGYVRAGIPLTAVEEILDYEEVPPALAHLGELFALKIKGDSMEPRMVEGDVVICRQTPDVESGATAVVLVNGDEATVKKLMKHKNGISLVANNPAYPPMFYTFEECESLPVRVVGQVVELRAKSF